jgi:hypothetical protein
METEVTPSKALRLAGVFILGVDHGSLAVALENVSAIVGSAMMIIGAC